MIPKRIVIDTNVCLDLFVFRDVRWRVLYAALKNGTVEAITRDDCRMEWNMVLGYPRFQLDDAARVQIAEEFDTLICRYVSPVTERSQIKLPVCTDRDDQKFLELSRDANADVLITKDKALLKLARKTRRDGLFSIMTPQAWTIDSTTIKTATE